MGIQTKEALIAEINSFKKEALKMQVKKEKQLNRKIDLQMQLKKAKDELKKLLEQ